jgi:UDP-N-acetylglucosamine pyrophosphorylase
MSKINNHSNSNIHKNQDANNANAAQNLEDLKKSNEESLANQQKANQIQNDFNLKSEFLKMSSSAIKNSIDKMSPQ